MRIHTEHPHTRKTTSKPNRKTAEAEVQKLLDEIAAAITAGDGQKVAGLWETPAFVIGPTMAMVIESRDQAAKFFGSARAQYNERGIVDTRADITDLEWIGDRLVVVKVRWPYLDAKGREIGAEASDYTLRRDDENKLKVREVLMRGVETGSH